ncbi:D-amino-acid oxidase-like [Chrysoperla carnea]|uniref:D-amino-acid oxidase-like n=1 Tax=Chrysoperla carnea TaxID=189513 RepID=UPI001D092DAC|nr:D-amino-acid oxidase-like [Chrysoperla carnea]
MNTEEQFDIVVVGGGIVGITTAINLQNKYPNVKITIVTEKLSPYTTGDGSAGFWMPYLCGSTPIEKVLDWSIPTLKLFHKLWRSELAEATGVSFVPVIYLFEKDDVTPKWIPYCHGSLDLSPDLLKKLGKEHGRSYREGTFFTSFTCEPSKFLPYLLRQFFQNGGKLIYSRVTSLSEVAEKYSDKTKKANVIVNCCGLGARTIVPDDEVYPIRGQVARVHAPWQFHIICSEANYIIPNHNAVILGGTAQKNDYSTEVYEEDTKAIFDGCSELVPGLKNSSKLQEWVGLRPARDSVRLELDKTPSKYVTDNNQNLILIHNYGHGGSGVTLSWGCAINVTNLLENTLIDLSLSSSTKSKQQEDTFSNIRSRL